MKKFIFIIVIFILTNSCKKNIIVPKDDFNKLFGTWQLTQTVGAISGDTINYEPKDYIIIVEYNKNGIYKKYKDDKRLTKKNFKFEEDALSSAHGNYIISYSKKFSKKMQISQWFKFVGNDTLILTDNCDDCFISTYVRE